MKPKASWKFSAPLEEVDVKRILREAEAGGPVRLVRFTIAGKQYVAINREHEFVTRYADPTAADPAICWEEDEDFPESPFYLNGELRVGRLGDYADGEVRIYSSDFDVVGKWGLTRDPRAVAKFLDLVETTVEVF